MLTEDQISQIAERLLKTNLLIKDMSQKVISEIFAFYYSKIFKKWKTQVLYPQRLLDVIFSPYDWRVQISLATIWKTNKNDEIELTEVINNPLTAEKIVNFTFQSLLTIMGGKDNIKLIEKKDNDSCYIFTLRDMNKVGYEFTPKLEKQLAPEFDISENNLILKNKLLQKLQPFRVDYLFLANRKPTLNQLVVTFQNEFKRPQTFLTAEIKRRLENSLLNFKFDNLKEMTGRVVLENLISSINDITPPNPFINSINSVIRKVEQLKFDVKFVVEHLFTVHMKKGKNPPTLKEIGMISEEIINLQIKTVKVLVNADNKPMFNGENKKPAFNGNIGTIINNSEFNNNRANSGVKMQNK